MKSRRMRWVGHVTRMGRKEVHEGFWWGDLRERHHLLGQGRESKIILKWISKKWAGGMGWIGPVQDRDRLLYVR
jgi:hypothetical protein